MSTDARTIRQPDGVLTLEQRLDRLSAQIEELAETARAQREERERWGELAHELTPVARGMMAAVSDELERYPGYVTFARGGAAIAEQVVTSFGEDDVAALGENIVLILNTVKDMTQPEVLGMLRRTAVTFGEDAPRHAPSTLALLGQLRDPEVRRGLARLLTMLRTLGAEQPPSAATSAPKE